MIVFLVARGLALLAFRLAERRARKRPPDGRDDGRGGELVLAA
jgi:hypothetical protein